MLHIFLWYNNVASKYPRQLIKDLKDQSNLLTKRKHWNHCSWLLKGLEYDFAVNELLIFKVGEFLLLNWKETDAENFKLSCSVYRSSFSCIFISVSIIFHQSITHDENKKEIWIHNSKSFILRMSILSLVQWYWFITINRILVWPFSADSKLVGLESSSASNPVSRQGCVQIIVSCTERAKSQSNWDFNEVVGEEEECNQRWLLWMILGSNYYQSNISAEVGLSVWKSRLRDDGEGWRDEEKLPNQFISLIGVKKLQSRFLPLCLENSKTERWRGHGWLSMK